MIEIAHTMSTVGWDLCLWIGSKVDQVGPGTRSSAVRRSSFSVSSFDGHGLREGYFEPVAGFRLKSFGS